VHFVGLGVVNWLDMYYCRVQTRRRVRDGLSRRRRQNYNVSILDLPCGFAVLTLISYMSAASN
jgi:hypothetical protein